MARDDEDPPWTRLLLVSAGLVLGVAVVIGAVVGVVAVGVAHVSGVGGAAASAPPSLFLPSGQPSASLEQVPDPSGGVSPSGGSPSPSPSPSASPSAKKPRKLSLQAQPTTVAANERITLTGTYRGHEGARLQVQRFDNGAWSDFPVQVSVRGGTFDTYITTGRSGVNRIRVSDPGAGKVSNPVRVTVR